jgi:hypothetical protein
MWIYDRAPAGSAPFFSNHGHMTNGYKQYLSSPYTRVGLRPEMIQRHAAFVWLTAEQMELGRRGETVWYYLPLHSGSPLSQTCLGRGAGGEGPSTLV